MTDHATLPASRAARAAAPTFPCENCGATCKDRPARKTRLCQPCNIIRINRSPAKIERVKAKLQRYYANPEARADLSRKVSATVAARTAGDPAFREQRHAHGKWLGGLGRGAQGAPAGHPSRVLAGKHVSDARLGWCAPAYRPIYRELCAKNRLTAAEGRTLTITQFEHERDEFRRGVAQPVSTLMRVRESLRYVWGSAV